MELCHSYCRAGGSLEYVEFEASVGHQNLSQEPESQHCRGWRDGERWTSAEASRTRNRLPSESGQQMALVLLVWHLFAAIKRQEA